MKKRIAVVDGLRGLSVLLVIASHSLIHFRLGMSPGARQNLRVVLSGDLGVRFFFVVSGFIITSLLLEELDKTGEISLVEFYKRRWVRLLPALYLVLAVTWIFSAVSTQPLTAGCFAAGATFTEAFFHNCGWDLAHLWSLTVEEVFYLVWPTILFLRRKRPVWAPLFVFIGLGAVARVLRYFAARGPYSGSVLEASLSILGQLDELILGAALGYFYRLSSDRFHAIFGHRPFLLRSSGAILILVTQILGQMGKAAFVILPLGGALQALGMTLILGSLLGCPSGLLSRVTRLKPLVWLGLVSYSLYLWQQLFFPGTVLGQAAGPFAQFPLAYAGMIAFAAGSYYFIERPFQRLAHSSGFLRPYAGRLPSAVRSTP